MSLINIVQHSWPRDKLLVAPLLVRMINGPIAQSWRTGGIWATIRVGIICNYTFIGVVLVQGAMLFWLHHKPYVWIRAPVIPFGVWTIGTILHLGQMMCRAIFTNRIVVREGKQLDLTPYGSLSKKRILLELLWLGLGTCMSYFISRGWAKREELHHTIMYLELVLLRLQDLKGRTKSRLSDGLEPPVGIARLEDARQEIRPYLQGTHTYFPEIVAIAEAIYLELTETMGLIKMAQERVIMDRKKESEKVKEEDIQDGH